MSKLPKAHRPSALSHLLSALISALLISMSLLATVEAAGIGVSVQKVDVTEYPKVRAYASIANSQGVPITELDQGAFVLSEDDKAIEGFQVQPIVNSQEPVAIVMTIDVSGSMKDEGKLDGAKKAAEAFVDTLGPKDSVALVSFSDQVKIVQGYTSDKSALKSAIAQLKTEGDTSIYDAMIQAAALQGAVPQQRKVILLLTDGADTTSKQSLDAALKATLETKVPVFVVGLGSDVKKDVLDKIAGSTSGQAFYVTAADRLREIFLSIGDQLRRQYVFTYTSKQPADGKEHTLGIKVAYRGEEAQGKTTFAAQGKPLAFDVNGITDASKVSGTQSIAVKITGGTAQEAQLLVDDQSRATVKAAPFAFTWDTAKEEPGIHRVVIQVKDAAGQITEKKFVVEVAAPTAVAAPTSAVLPTNTPAVAPTAKPAEPSPTPAAETSPTLYAAAGAGVLLLVGVGAAAIVLSRRKPTPAPPPPVTAPAPPAPIRNEATVATDRTEVMGPLDVGATVVHGAAPARPPALPRASLRLVQAGGESTITITQAETTMGREPSNPIVIRDPLASRRHARIVIEGSEFFIEDLKSLNGTRVNGEPLTGRRKLARNDQIKVGEVTLTFLPE